MVNLSRLSPERGDAYRVLPRQVQRALDRLGRTERCRRCGVAARVAQLRNAHAYCSGCATASPARAVTRGAAPSGAAGRGRLRLLR